MVSEKLSLTVADYIIIGITLTVSATIGVFFQFISKKTNDDFLLAGKDMPILPVSFSLMATFMSSTSLIGVPSEMYNFGTSMTLMNVGFILAPIIASYVFVPIYFTNDITTVYEYLEKRFGKRIRIIISAAFTLQTGLFTSAALYAPAIVLSTVTNLPMWLSIIMIGIVCTFYCTLGGMKAVLWADLFQATLMYVCLLAIIIKGCLEMGGFGKILQISYDGGRIFIPKFSLDMEEQYTATNVIMQGIIVTLSYYCGSQVQVQRLRTLKNLNRSRIAALCSSPMLVIFHLLCCFCGFILYAHFRNCDPMTNPNQPINAADQMIPYFITSTMSEYPGLPGLCITGIFSASLSTISSSLNSLAAVTVEDFIQPIWPNVSQYVIASKIISFVFGGLGIAFSFLLAPLGNLVKMNNVITGMVAGPNLGVFILAACTKGANEMGTLIGVVAGLAMAMICSFFPSKSKPPYLPISNECPDIIVPGRNISNLVSSYSFPRTIPIFESINNITATAPEEERLLIPISFMWSSTIGLLTCLIVGYLSSIIITFFQKSPNEVPDMFLSPIRTRFSKKNNEKISKTNTNLVKLDFSNCQKTKMQTESRF